MKREYAIVDIETTGGNAQASRITEIAIIIHNGTNVIDKWQTLVNPQKPIPLPIFALTGINDDMVRHAPVFNDIAHKVADMLTGRIFVAHNVNFDYTFVRHQLEEAGIKWTATKLCTVRAARKIKPGLHSYSLGNLCRSLNIDLENRHRAGGDAAATALLFSQLISWDTDGVIEAMVKKTSQDQRLPPNLPPADFEQLPGKPGVYYFYNKEKKVVYVGKAVNLKKRVASHFSGHKTTSQRQHFLRDIYSISYEVCGTELMALLLECTEIKKLWPIYNRALKSTEPKYGLYSYEARSGYKYLAVSRLIKHQTSVELFNSEYEGINLLRNLAVQFSIDHRFCKYGKSAESEGYIKTDISNLPNVAEHNNSINQAVDYISGNRQSFAIIDKGREKGENSCILVENGHFYGMGYIPADLGFTGSGEIKDYVTRYSSSHYIMQLISSFAQKYPAKVFFEVPV